MQFLRQACVHSVDSDACLTQEVQAHALASAQQARAQEAEESQAAAKAAAKKAKKQRQKANKQSQAQAALPVAPATPAASQPQAEAERHGMLAAPSDGAVAAAAASASSPTSRAEVDVQVSQGADGQTGIAVPVRPVTLQQGEDAGTSALTGAVADMQLGSMTAGLLSPTTSPALSLFNCPLTKVSATESLPCHVQHCPTQHAVIQSKCVDCCLCVQSASFWYTAWWAKWRGCMITDLHKGMGIAVW